MLNFRILLPKNIVRFGNAAFSVRLLVVLSAFCMSFVAVFPKYFLVTGLSGIL